MKDYSTTHVSQIPCRISGQSVEKAFGADWSVGGGDDHFYSHLFIGKIMPVGPVHMPTPGMEAGEVPLGMFMTGTQDRELWDESSLWMCGMNSASPSSCPDRVTGITNRSADGVATWERGEIPHTLLMTIAPVDTQTDWSASCRHASFPDGIYTGLVFKTADIGKTREVQLEAEGLALMGLSAVDGSVARIKDPITRDSSQNRWSNDLPVDRGGTTKTVDGDETRGTTLDFERVSVPGVYAVDSVPAWEAGEGFSGTPLVPGTLKEGDRRAEFAAMNNAAPFGNVVSLRKRDISEERSASWERFGYLSLGGYVSWSRGELRESLPLGVQRNTEVTVHTPAGVSNPLPLRELGEFRVGSVNPDRAFQIPDGSHHGHDWGWVHTRIRVSLKKEGRVMKALFNTVWSVTKSRATADLGAAQNAEFLTG